MQHLQPDKTHRSAKTFMKTFAMTGADKFKAKHAAMLPLTATAPVDAPGH